MIPHWLGLAVCLVALTTAQAELRINQVQFVGSHNSYKQAMSEPYRTLCLGLTKTPPKPLSIPTCRWLSN